MPTNTTRRVLVLRNGYETRIKRWKIAAAAGFVALLVTAGVSIAAIASSSQSFSGISGEVYDYDDTSFSLIGAGMLLAAVPTAAAGDTQGGAIEMATVLGTANTALSLGDWTYVMSIQELGIATVTSGTYQAELFVDGVSQGSLYITQGTSNAAAIEGVTLTWSLGSSLPATAAFVVKLSSV